ncbi:50S ribosomal protein L24 [Rickettsiella grylli]|uniref:Large ribosomal subunit protein uL24 n=1 Tax=Rickettsiella grylli TaxID=59196 RepID=A8PNP3_9COXI|nr:50S ribosomal protein L24 [Rickettsiella grylli]EDP46126.1 ribosomal protein L24 [Rickettsiella grylli]OIZ99636.1 50S ribosomal protein L24 [Rickettsiella grylli]
MRKIRKGDTVIVLTGKDKGKQGKVLAINVSKNSARVEGINVVKKHVKPNPQKNVTGGIVTREAFIHLTNVAIYNPITKKADKVGIKIVDNEKKVRIFKSNNERVDI